MKLRYFNNWERNNFNAYNGQPKATVTVSRYSKTAQLETNHGSSDCLIMYRDEDLNYYVLNINAMYGYVGVCIFKPEDLVWDGRTYNQPDQELFLQDEWELEDFLGKRKLEQSDPTLIRKMASHLY